MSSTKAQRRRRQRRKRLANRTPDGGRPGPYAHAPRAKPQTKPSRERPAAAKLPVWKKLLFSAVTTLALLALLEGSLALVGVRPVLHTEDPYVGFVSHIPLFVEEQGADGTATMVTARNKLRFFNAQSFPREKPPGTYRIFCLGGSTTYGRPYDDATSFCGWLRAFLPEADPSRDWEVINAGGISYASYRVATLAEELSEYEPDLLVVYSGQNEFLERRTYGTILQTPPLLRGLGATLSRTRTYAALKWGIDRFRSGNDSDENRSDEENGGSSDDGKPAMLTAEVEAVLDQSVGPKDYHRDELFEEQVLEHYRYNLGRIVDIARSVGAEVVLVAPASNLRDCSPFKSEHRDGLAGEDLNRWQALFDRAQEAAADGRPKEALEALDEAATIDGRYAQLHYLRGRVLWELGRYDESKTALARARDEDVCPLRALGPMREIVAEVAAARGVPLVDFATLAESRSEHGIPGEDLFLDHVHPTVDGNRTLALAILDAMDEERIVRPAASWNDGAIARVTRHVEAGLDEAAHARALRNLAKVLTWAGKYEEGRKLAEKATAMQPDDAVARFQLGVCAQGEEDLEGAANFYRQAIEIQPGYGAARTNLGCVLEQQGDVRGAMEHFYQAIAIDGQDHKARFNLGRLLLGQGQFPAAAEQLAKVAQLRPLDAEAYSLLAEALARLDRLPGAITAIEKAVELDPDDADAHNKLGGLQAAVGNYAEARLAYRQALEVDPEHAGAMENLAWLLATAPDSDLRNGEEAVRLARQSCQAADPPHPATLDALAAALAEAGRFDKAVTTAGQALALAEARGQRGLAAAIRARMELYRNGRPYRE